MEEEGGGHTQNGTNMGPGGRVLHRKRRNEMKPQATDFLSSPSPPQPLLLLLSRISLWSLLSQRRGGDRVDGVAVQALEGQRGGDVTAVGR